jgi:hypothetical protein
MSATRTYTSSLWGINGERWNPTSRLPDFSFAGYHKGEDPIPVFKVVKDFKTDYGAKGNGIADDTQAWVTMANDINAGKVNGAVFIPAGTYVIKEKITIRRGNIALRGGGEGKTILYFPKSLYEVYGRGPDTGLGYSWSDAFLTVQGDDNGSKMTNVVQNASRGSNKLIVADAAGMSPGQMVRLRMWPESTTPSANTLGKHIYNDFAEPGTAVYNTYPSINRSVVDWIVTVTSKSGNTITLERPLRLDVRTRWHPEIWSHKPTVQEFGIEDMTFRMDSELIQTGSETIPAGEYGGHHKGGSKGANAIRFLLVTDCWVKNVRIEDADNALHFLGSSFCTAVNLIIAAVKRSLFKGEEGDIPGKQRQSADPAENWYYDEIGYHGHHGVRFSSGTNTGDAGVGYMRWSQDNLVQDLIVAARYQHDVTVSLFANGNVISRMRALDANLDHHKGAPYENLFTEIISKNNLKGRFFASGGGPRDQWGPKSAARTTLWNIQLSKYPGKGTLMRAPVEFPHATIIGMNAAWNLSDVSKSHNSVYWIDQWPGAQTNPLNLYEAQLAKRIGYVPDHKTPRAASLCHPPDLAALSNVRRNLGGGASRCNALQYFHCSRPVILQFIRARFGHEVQ